MLSSGAHIVRVAIEVCCNERFRNEALIVPEDVADAGIDGVYLRKRKWDKRVKRRALVLLDKYNLEHCDKKRVLGIVSCIAMRMLTWVEYYHGTYGLPRDYCISIFTPEVLTDEGIIDENKILDILRFNRNLNTLQEYELACHFCLKEKIAFLFKMLKKEEKDTIYDPTNPNKINKPSLVTFWSYFVMGDIDKLKGQYSVDQYKLECAISCGSKIAVQYCLEKTSLARRRENIVDAAVSVIKHRMLRENQIHTPNSRFRNDLVIFGDTEYDRSKFQWVPNHLFGSIFFFLLSKTTDEQKADISRKLYIALKSDKCPYKSTSQTRILDLFLHWPYQDKLLEFVNLSWSWLPEKLYGNLLLSTFGRIEINKGDLYYGEHKCYDYKKLLMKLWKKSPDGFKRYAFRDKTVSIKDEDELQVKIGYILREAKQLIVGIFMLKKFNAEDMQNIKSILNDATTEEKAGFLLSEDGNMICVSLLANNRREYFDELVRCCCPTQENAIDFRKRYSVVVTRDICLDHIRNDRWDEAESALNWCDLTDEEIQKLKKTILSTHQGKQTCRELYFTNIKSAERYIEWGYFGEECIQSYKEKLLVEDDGLKYCKEMIAQNSTKELEYLIRWVFPAEEDYKKFMDILANNEAFFICEALILQYQSPEDSKTLWQRVEEFLSWCYLDDDCFFKEKFLEHSGENLILQLVESGQLSKAEELLVWFELEQDKINKYKKECFYYSSIDEFFYDMCNSDEDSDIFNPYGSKENAITEILQWFIVDEDCVIEFKSRHRCYGVDHFVTKILYDIQKYIKSSTDSYDKK